MSTPRGMPKRAAWSVVVVAVTLAAASYAYHLSIVSKATAETSEPGRLSTTERVAGPHLSDDPVHGIHWERSLTAALDRAQAERKPILLVISTRKNGRIDDTLC